MFSCVVSNAYGTATSSNAVLTVQQPPYFTEPMFTNGNFQATLHGTPTTSYTIQVSTNLTTTNWTPLKIVTTTAGGITNVIDNSSNQPLRFYRANGL